MRFKQLVVDGEYDIHTVDYAYDKLSRLLSADYYTGSNTDGSAFREHAYGFDVAGNRTSASVALNGASPTVTNYTYNNANQLTGDGTDTFTYDANGNLWKTNTTITHTWDRANRMLTAPGSTSYAYDGKATKSCRNRIQQTVSSVVTDYLLDLQPGLTKVIAATTNANTSRYLHDPRGIFAHEDNAGAWDYTLADGLGSVRAEVTTAGAISANQHYAPFGQPFATNGSFDAGFGFTGEQTDDNDLLYLRARYYNPALGIFPSLDPLEGISNRPMSLNGYSWVEGNTPNRVDSSGLFSCDAEGETWSDLPSACVQLDTAFQRAQNVDVPDISGTVEDGIVNFGQLKSYVQNNFGFAIVGYSPTIPEGITDCTVTQTLVGVGGAPAKLSLVRTASALLHVAAYFNRIGISLDSLRTKFGNGSALQLVSDGIIVNRQREILQPFQGQVPIEAQGRNVYLGSEVQMYTVVHELGHLFDKVFNTTPSLLLSGLRIRSSNGLPLYTVLQQDSGDVSNFIAGAVGANLGLGGRANNDEEPRETWADMFMTAVLDGQNIQSLGEIAGLIGWNPTSGANRWVGEFKRAYTLVAIRRLMLDHPIASGSAEEGERISFLTSITGLINPAIFAPNPDYP